MKYKCFSWKGFIYLSTKLKSLITKFFIFKQLQVYSKLLTI